MCDLSLVALGTQAAGVGVSTQGAYNKSKADKAAYNYQADVAQGNAQIAEWQAQDAVTRGNRDAAQQRVKTKQLKGEQRASLAARGIDLGEGSALNILTDTDYMGENDANVIRDNAAREAWGLRTDAKNYRSNAEMLRNRAAAESPGRAAAATFLGGAGQVSSSWYNMKTKT